MLNNNMVNQSTESRLRQGPSLVFIKPDATISVTVDNFVKFTKATVLMQLKSYFK